MAFQKPQAQPPVPRKPRGATLAVSGPKTQTTKEQEDFEADAVALAASLGWEGEPTWLVNGIQIKDAQTYFRKVLHERHVEALNPTKPATSVEAVCEHLAITDPEATEIVRNALDVTLEAELAANA